MDLAEKAVGRSLRRWAVVAMMAVVAVMVAVPVGVTTVGADAGASQIADNSRLIQCVTDCIKDIGRDEVDTCHLRCARHAPKQNVDCMGVYKGCNKSCGKDKKCRRSCKKGLMKCK